MPDIVRPRFDDLFMQLASGLAKRSHCVKKQVGAVLAKESRIISIGYNGPPSGTYNCDEVWPKQGCPRTLEGGSCSLALHAEQNAIIYALRFHNDLQGATMYTTLTPCLACARMIFSVGIQRVVYQEGYAAYKGLAQEEGLAFLEQLGIQAEEYAPGPGFGG